MKITHYLTIDRGTGPIVLINIEDGESEPEVMLRITHKAVYQRTVVVDAEAMRAQLASVQMRTSEQTLAADLQPVVSEEVAKWLTGRNQRIRTMRWKDGIHGVIIHTEAEELAYDAELLKLATLVDGGGDAPKPRRRMMMG